MTVRKLKCAVLAVFASAVGVAFGDIIQPTGDAAADTAAIQKAINAGGTVELGEGTFLINATLDVKNGVTVQGQGWEKTVIKAASGSSIRCAKVLGASKLIGVTVTGGNSSSRGAGVLVAGGTVSWCCISNNTSSAADAGGGFALAEGTVDHSIIAFNKLAGQGWGGGIGGKPLTGSVVIDTCLIYGNSNSGGSGGGVGFDNPVKPVLIRNCTITGNTCSTYNTGGVYIYNNASADISMVNTIVAGNTLSGAENNLKIHSGYKANFKNCFFGLEDEASGGVACRSGDPKFVDAAKNDYRLDEDSTAIGAGVTYEGIGVDLDNVKFAATPSIGCYEGAGDTSVVADPVFDPAGGTFYPSVDVVLSCKTGGATIRYTTDESEPTVESAVYEGPIRLTATTTVRARAFKDGVAPSEIVSATYECEAPVPPVLGEVTVTAKAKKATISGAVESVGNLGATACDVYLALDGAPAEKIASGVAAAESFSYVIAGLDSATEYAYTLSVSNNASFVSGAEKNGVFTTATQGSVPQPTFGTFAKAFVFTADGYAGSEALENFPVLVRLGENSPEDFSYADVREDGSDIRFADEAGNELPCEIDTWNASGESLIWVRVPALTKSTTFTMYYDGKPHTAASPASVWDWGYAGVWHMGEADGDCADSTGHQLAATPAGVTTANKRYTGADAPVGGARTVTTASAGKGYLLVPNYDSLAFGDTFTMSGWVHATGTTGYPRIFSRKNSYTDGNGWELEMGASTTTGFSARGSGNTPTVSGNFAGTGFKNAWLHIAVVYDGGTATVYGNGVAIATGTVGKANPDNGLPLAINCNPSGVDGCVYGEFDECRLLDGAVGTDWVKAEFDQGVATTKFLSAESVEVIAATEVAKPVFIPAATEFYPSIDVELACTTEDATIRYTTDGSDPTEASAVYTAAITLDATTTVKAFATKDGLAPSGIAEATYTLVDPVPPAFGEVVMTPRAKKVKVSGVIESLGNLGATACDVYFALNDAPAEKVAEGVTGSFGFKVSELEPDTTYSYVLSIVNNATYPTRAETSGSFTTLASDVILPAETPAETVKEIQDAIADAAEEEPAGTVVLGEGVFEIDAELLVGDGVTVVGQGWTNTVIKQTVSARVMTLSGGAKVEGVTLTGGKSSSGWFTGAGALVYDGTISWCCVSNNTATGGNNYGGGIRIYKGQIDHSLVAFNKAGDPGTGFGGAICYTKVDTSDAMGDVLVDTCLIYGNTSNKDGGAVYNGNYRAHDNMLTVRNTTIADNAATGNGGGVYSARAQLTLVNCILADNTAADGSNYSIDGSVVDEVAEQTQNCFFGNGTAALGETSVSGFQVDFKDAENGDYHLKATSQAAEVGAWYDGIADDLDGVTRKDPKTAAGSYECTEIDHGVIQLNPIVVTASTVSAEVAGSIASLGEGTSATVTLRYGLSAEALTEEKTACGIVTDFAFTLTGLTHATHYFYAVTVENDVGRTASATGDFYTQYDPEIALLPSADPAQNVEMLNAALMAAAPTHGTITLGEGVFAIDDELTVGSGITLVGQSWEKTVLRQTAAGKRVLTLDGGATLKGVTVTGGLLDSGAKQGGGAYVNDGTITWCCISNNAVTVGNSNYGGGVFLKKGQIDHSIIVDNAVQTTTGTACLGGGIGTYEPNGDIVIDTCLVEGNRASYVNGKVKGGGLGIHFMYRPFTVTVRNTTITGNAAGDAGDPNASMGGAICTDCPTTKSAIMMLNCIVAANTTEGTEATVALDGSNGSRDVDYCLFDKEVDKLGENSKVGDPLFKDAANGDYRLFYDSPANGIGHWYEGIAVDLDGRKRGRRPAAGCYEICPGFMLMVK